MYEFGDHGGFRGWALKILLYPLFSMDLRSIQSRVASRHLRTNEDFPINRAATRAASQVKVRNLEVTFIGLEYMHGLEVRVVQGRLEIDGSKLPLFRDAQARFESDPQKDGVDFKWDQRQLEEALAPSSHTG